MVGAASRLQKSQVVVVVTDQLLGCASRPDSRPIDSTNVH